MSISVQSSAATLLALQARNAAPDLQDASNANGGAAIATTSQDGASAGAVSLAKQLSAHKDFLSILSDKSGVGQLVDGDLTTEGAKLQALNVQQQLSAQPLSISNQAPQLILQLFKA